MCAWVCNAHLVLSFLNFFVLIYFFLWKISIFQDKNCFGGVTLLYTFINFFYARLNRRHLDSQICFYIQSDICCFIWSIQRKYVLIQTSILGGEDLMESLKEDSRALKAHFRNLINPQWTMSIYWIWRRMK